jgi:hypothetical protein
MAGIQPGAEQYLAAVGGPVGKREEAAEALGQPSRGGADRVEDVELRRVAELSGKRDGSAVGRPSGQRSRREGIRFDEPAGGQIIQPESVDVLGAARAGGLKEDLASLLPLRATRRDQKGEKGKEGRA